jgi:hypothetical protein
MIFMRTVFRFSCSPFLAVLLFFCFGCSSLLAAEIEGIVRDSATNEPIAAATLYLQPIKKHTRSGLNGTFEFKKIPIGTYTLTIRIASYKPTTLTVEITDKKQEVELDIAMKSLLTDEVVISAYGEKTSDESARKFEKNSDNVTSVVSAKSIAVSPDLTVANVLQRVSGVSIERNSNGDGQHAIIRGMDKRYNYTLVNGVKIPSPDNKNRYVPLDIFPSDLLDYLEVTKSLTPNMEGDAIGGAMNMVMKNAPSDFTVHANLGTGYNGLFFDRKFTKFDNSSTNFLSPREVNGNTYQAKPSDFPTQIAIYNNVQPMPNIVGSVSVGGRFLEDKNMGAVVAASFQNTYRGANSIFFESEVDRVSNIPQLQNIYERQFSTQQIRSGLHAKLDYQFSADNKIDLYSAYIHLRENEMRYQTDTNLILGRAGAGTGRITLSFRSRQQIQEIVTSTLRGEHKLLPQFKLQWIAAYSKASNDEPDRTQFQATTGVAKTPSGFVQDSVYLSSTTYRRWTRNSDKDLSGFLNLNYTPEIAGTTVEFLGGGMYRGKSRENYFNEYNLRPSFSPQAYKDYASQSFTVFNPFGSENNPLNYTSHENVIAFYGQAKFRTGDLQTLAGVRIEKIKFDWLTAAAPSVEGRSGDISYADILPSIHFKYFLSAKENLRLSYYSSISRPGFYEVIPYRIRNEDYDEAGNPYLKRVQASNIDLRYEWFPAALDQVLVGAFYKKIRNPIEYALKVTGTSIVYAPDNFGTATNFGAEFDVTKYFNWFGIRANYTYTNSSITTAKTVRYRDANNALTERIENQTRPLQGQSDHIANLSLLYKNTEDGIDAQISGVYTGKRIVTVSPFKDNDFWQSSFLQLDLSAEYRISEQFTLYAKVNNLLNTPLEYKILLPNSANTVDVPFQDAPNTVLVRRDYYLQTYLLGIRYRL